MGQAAASTAAAKQMLGVEREEGSVVGTVQGVVRSHWRGEKVGVVLEKLDLAVVYIFWPGDRTGLAVEVVEEVENAW